MRAVFVVVVLFLTLGVIAAYVTYQQVFPAATAPQTVSGTPASFTEVAAGNNSTVTTRQDYLINSTLELAQLWQMTDAAGQPPVVDFSHNDIIAVFGGTTGTVASLKVSSVVDTAANRVVIVSITKPGASCVPSPSSQAPYEILELAKSALPYTHQDSISISGCL